MVVGWDAVDPRMVVVVVVVVVIVVVVAVVVDRFATMRSHPSKGPGPIHIP
jgi:hypothetical protein